jgi:alkylation response protein AidB-like acyl-CoA dehydrogenase
MSAVQSSTGIAPRPFGHPRDVPRTPGKGVEWALERIGARAGELDREPRFPTENFSDLAVVGALSTPPDGLSGGVRLVRAVAAVDASTARILDGHLNGIERLTLAGPEPLRTAELAQIGEGKLLLGVWGADPAAGEGPPARLEQVDGQLVLCGVKTFCSGAGAVQRALVIAADQDGSGRLAYVDTTSRVSIDRGWYRASGLRSSESHRVEFHDAPVLALLGSPGELSREPYFSRDAIRTSATWAGLADCILAETLTALDPARLDAVQAHGLGRMRVAQGTIDRWLQHTTTELDQLEDPRPGVDPAVLALECRVALYECALLISGAAARVCGSRALIGASTLDRARRDLDLFLLQHRLDPKITKLGTEMLATEQP